MPLSRFMLWCLAGLLLLSACQATPGSSPEPSPTNGPSTTPTASPVPADSLRTPAQPPTGGPPPTVVSPPPLQTHVPLPIVSPGPADDLLPTGPSGPTELAEVVRVVDGDTIIVRIDGEDYRLRYIGMDTPETVRPGHPVEWMGPEATEANRRLVEDAAVVLEKDVSETDRFGRLLRYVWLPRDDGWLFVNLELVRAGFAQVSTFPPDVKYAGLFLAAEQEAREADRGLWGEPSDDGP